jgi:hypothetical protein
MGWETMEKRKIKLHHSVSRATSLGDRMSFLPACQAHTAPGLSWEVVNSSFILILNLARQSFEMATKLPFGEIKSSLLASSREESRVPGTS